MSPWICESVASSPYVAFQIVTISGEVRVRSRGVTAPGGFIRSVGMSFIFS